MQQMRDVRPEELEAVEGGWYSLFAGALLVGAVGWYYWPQISSSANWIWQQANSAWTNFYNNLTSDNSDYSYDTGDYYS